MGSIVKDNEFETNKRYCIQSSKIYLLRDGLFEGETSEKLKEHFLNCDFCKNKFAQIDELETRIKHKIPWEKPDSMILEQLEVEVLDLAKKFEIDIIKEDKQSSVKKILNFFTRKPLDENRY